METEKTFFHYDVGDFRSLVLFVYLTDVDEHCGPNIIIQGTHRKTPFRKVLTRYLSDEEAARQFAGNIRVICGKRGYGFFEDLTCYHKRSLGMQKRLMLTISYTLQRTPPGR